MTRFERLARLWYRISAFVGIFLLLVSAFAAGCALMYWLDKGERMQLVQRFPAVRAEERAACVREFTARLDGVADLKSQMETTNKLAQATLQFLGDRARINDKRAAVMLQQSRAAAAAATAAAQRTEQVDQKVSVAVVKADEAASTAKAVDKKLDTATHPPLPAKPWAGSRQ
jgi:hypothetical protein